jgi:hypothetical protein
MAARKTICFYTCIEAIFITKNASFSMRNWIMEIKITDIPLALGDGEKKTAGRGGGHPGHFHGSDFPRENSTEIP